MLYREIMAVCSQIHTKHINKVCGQKVELLNVKNGGTYSDHWAKSLKIYVFSFHVVLHTKYFPILTNAYK